MPNKVKQDLDRLAPLTGIRSRSFGSSGNETPQDLLDIQAEIAEIDEHLEIINRKLEDHGLKHYIFPSVDLADDPTV